jgi:hypothetical protein
VVYRRTPLQKINGFDPSLGPGADYDLYLRITRVNMVCCHGCFVVDYRLHGSSMSVAHLSMLEEALKILNSQWGFLKESDCLIRAFEAGKKHWRDYYETLEMSDQIFKIVETNLPANATVAVASNGKRELLKLGSRRVLHFPQSDSNDRGKLFQQGIEGSVEVRWIEAGMRYEFRLFGGPKYSKQLAAISVAGVADAVSVDSRGSTPLGQSYLIAVPNPVPTPNRFGQTTISWNTGDGSEGRIYLSQGGAYCSPAPQDSNEAISRLEAIRDRGAEYLLLPSTAFWWLDHYQEFREHLEARYPVVVRDESTCIIFDLRESATTPSILHHQC